MTIDNNKYSVIIEIKQCLLLYRYYYRNKPFPIDKKKTYDYVNNSNTPKRIIKVNDSFKHSNA